MLKPFSDFSIPLTQSVVWILFFIVAVIVIIMAFVFNYHWKYHGIGGHEAVVMKTIYFIGTFALLFATYILAMMF